MTDSADDGLSAAGSRESAVPPVPLGEPVLPDGLKQHADAVLVVQQRIERLELAHEVAAQLSREVRRAVQTARVDVLRGQRQLDRLRRRLDALDG